MLIQKNILVKGKKVSYWESDSPHAEYTVAFFMPGPYSGLFLKEFEQEFGSNIRLITVDYPGRGDSDAIDDNSFEEIASRIILTFEQIDIVPDTLVGISYGTAVLSECVKQGMCTRNIIIIGGGEFFHPILSGLLGWALRLCIVFPWIRKSLYSLLLRYNPTLESFGTFSLQSISAQALATMQYRVPNIKLTDSRTLIITLKDDNFVREGSLKKLQLAYPNSILHSASVKHSLVMNDKYLDDIRSQIIPLINYDCV